MDHHPIVKVARKSIKIYRFVVESSFPIRTHLNEAKKSGNESSVRVCARARSSTRRRQQNGMWLPSRLMVTAASVDRRRSSFCHQLLERLGSRLRRPTGSSFGVLRRAKRQIRTRRRNKKTESGILLRLTTFLSHSELAYRPGEDKVSG